MNEKQRECQIMTSGSSLEGRTMLVTGASDGIGKETASVLAGPGARAILHGRNADRCEVARRGILKSHPKATVDIEVADFSSLDQVRGPARRVNRTYPGLDVLINNAGVYMTRRVVTIDGLETTFAVNHLAHFVLTLLLLDLLRRSAPARIITVSSIAHTIQITHKPASTDKLTHFLTQPQFPCRFEA